MGYSKDRQATVPVYGGTHADICSLFLPPQDYDNGNGTMEATSSCSFPVWPQKTRQLWANIFKIFYKLHPTLDEGGPSKLLENSLELLELGEEILAADIIFHAIDTTLVGFSQQLYRCIADDPITWVMLAVRIRSKTVFRESMIHLIGKWGLLGEKDRMSLPESVRELCVKKDRDLRVTKRGTELQLINYQPRLLRRGSDATSGGSGNVGMWKAIAIWRQWLCRSFFDKGNYRTPDGGAAFYRAISAGIRSYLDALDQRALALPLSGYRGSWEEIRQGLEGLAGDMKQIVSDLLVNHANYDSKTMGELPYLTCCQISEEDLPWVISASETSSETQRVEEIAQSSSGSYFQHGYQLDTLTNPHFSREMVSTNSNLVSPDIQSTSSYESIRTFPQLDYLTWDWTMDFTAAGFTSQHEMLPVYPLAESIWQPQLDHCIDTPTFGVPPVTEPDENISCDGSMAFL